jgi:hypothetical protein
MTLTTTLARLVFLLGIGAAMVSADLLTYDINFHGRLRPRAQRGNIYLRFNQQ